MKVSENLGSLFLGIWLILASLVSLLSIGHGGVQTLVPLLALAAGLLILLGSGKLPGNLGGTLLAIWLILRGLSPFLAADIPYYGLILNLLGLLAGLLILLGR